MEVRFILQKMNDVIGLIQVKEERDKKENNRSFVAYEKVSLCRNKSAIYFTPLIQVHFL